MHKIILLFILAIISTCLWQCASQTTPMGGPKDTIPPRLIKSSPVPNQKNFNGKSVELTFNEFITLSNPKDEILISPSVGKNVEYKYKKNTVSITPKDGWQDSTTYSIAIREGVKDLTESNPPENLRLAFSTGPSIDSLAITGKVRFALKEGIPEKISIAIFQADTFDIFEDTPTYFTMTNKKGQFSIENIKEGHYKIYAFDDKNKNLKVESRTEKFGFLSEPIALTQNVDSLTIRLVSLDTRKPKLNNVRNNGLYTRFAFNKYLDHYSLIAHTKDSIVHSYGKDQTEIILYNPKEIIDSLKIVLSAMDTVKQQIDTTLYIKSIEPNYIPDDFTIQPGKLKYSNTTQEFTHSFQLTKPLSYLNLDSIYIQSDTTHQIRLVTSDLHYDSINKKLSLSKKIPRDSLFKNPNFKIEFFMRKGSLVSIEGDTSKIYSAPIPYVKPDQTGTLLIQTETQQPHFIIQLTNAGNELIEEIKDTNKYTFQYLPPQNYKIRIIIDSNNNGRWDAGNIFKNEEPEEILFYRTAEKKYEIPIRANWELGPIMLIF